jgi:hypothetical protein
MEPTAAWLDTLMSGSLHEVKRRPEWHACFSRTPLQPSKKVPASRDAPSNVLNYPFETGEDMLMWLYNLVKPSGCSRLLANLRKIRINATRLPCDPLLFLTLGQRCVRRDEHLRQIVAQMVFAVRLLRFTNRRSATVSQIRWKICQSISKIKNKNKKRRGKKRNW